MAIIERKIKIKTKILFSLFSLFLSNCSGISPVKGASWEGQLNFMHITEEKMQMYYSVDVMGQKIFLDGYYEVVKKNTDTVIFRLDVKELEFGNKIDGKPFCRIWGLIDESSIKSYLHAEDCLPIS